MTCMNVLTLILNCIIQRQLSQSIGWLVGLKFNPNPTQRDAHALGLGNNFGIILKNGLIIKNQ